MNQDTERIEVSDEVIAICAANATRKTPGVMRMEGGISNAIRRNLLGKESLAKGIKVDHIDKDSTIEIDTHVIVKYGSHIPSVAWDIQENVKNKIAEMTGLTVSAVNINVEGVEADDKK
ncbi:MAG: Asp23/Gls24 family envelope stress response protein [Firmicutes bacterium]|nr:Asp23/Gls24 family envelope stress response protein [Bacillota bacterium]